MKIVDLTQRSPEWLRWRAQGVTASEAAIVLGRWPARRTCPPTPMHNAGSHGKTGPARPSRSATAPCCCPCAGSPRSTRSCGPPSTAKPSTRPGSRPRASPSSSECITSEWGPARAVCDRHASGLTVLPKVSPGTLGRTARPPDCLVCLFETAGMAPAGHPRKTAD
jgi:hypothetical protein